MNVGYALSLDTIAKIAELINYDVGKIYALFKFSFSSNDVVRWACTDQCGRSENIAEAENRKAGGKEEP
ncbi:hypothetical protein PAL_GLEAN10023387 [Pteropus alecto]|uniref:Uncharacterized protein n=1 Tax=Pteropus alecto TaxID=9402 RepID=L5K0W7_PTEAL|nr:hypothetical protein PAL_GLEAN10023387 [Pteropus alecto]